MKKYLLCGFLMIFATMSFADNSASYENRIIRDKNTYLYNGSIVSETELELILEKSPACYNQWKSGKNMLTAGWVFCGVGGGLALGGLAFIGSSPGATIGVCCGGLVCELVALGLSLGGDARKNKAIDLHNARLTITNSNTPFAAPVEFGVAINL